MGGDSNSTQRTVAEPWAGATDYLGQSLQDLDALKRSGGLRTEPYTDPLSWDTRHSQNAIRNQALGPQLTDQASGYLAGAMQGGQNPELAKVQEAVTNQALDSVIPAVNASFSGSGMPNSSMAADTAGMAAGDAVARAIAPYAYDAYDTAENRAMAAAGMAPSMDAAGYLPAQMLGQSGAQQDARAESIYNAQQQAPIDELMRYLNASTQVAGLGGSTSTRGPSGSSTLGNIGAGGLTGLGTYGALMANPATAGFAIPGALGAGILGML